MINGEFIKYIDTKGKEHNAQVISFRSDEMSDEPLVTLSYVAPGRTIAVTVTDVVHQSHPSKDEPNPDLPRIVLHAWKYVDEGHVAPAADHPVFDHAHERPKTDEFGQVIPKARPHFEKQVAQHKSNPAFVPRVAAFVPSIAEVAEVAPTPPIHEHHPGNPKSEHFATKCEKCGAATRKLSFHQGGHEFDAGPSGSPQDPQSWTRHACKQDVLAANASAALKSRKPHQYWCASNEGKECDCRPTVTVTSVSPEADGE
jgi:hypothetical protein